jgi:hypothetical protein
MNHPFAPTPRRGFLARIAAGAAALTALPALSAEARSSRPRDDQDKWLAALTGKHRCLFDFPNHADGLPLLHMYNYLNTYKTAYGAKESEVNAVCTFYFIGPTSSIPLAFNDAMWAKYKLGEYLKLTDPKTKAPATRNMFNAPQDGDPVLFGGKMAAASIQNLQRMGGSFLLCNNAFGFLVGQLAQGGAGAAADIDKELRANMLPGVTAVPAMVIAIEKAQEAGVAYNRQ